VSSAPKPVLQWLGVTLLVTIPAAAAPKPPASASAASSALAPPVAAAPAASGAPANTESCVEQVPPGKDRPRLFEKIPDRAVSGHALTLSVEIEHGKGETVLPTGFHLLTESPEAKALEREGFILPDPSGPSGPKLSRKETGAGAMTTLELALVPLPPKPGRHQLLLPPLPIAVARASGEVITLCTQPHSVTVEDPIANLPDPKPRGNPQGRRQREVWTTAKHVVFAALIALVVGALAALLISRWLKRPKKRPPPPPPRPPWEVALEALHDLRHAGLMREGRFAEHFDRVSDVLRRYLGDRYGYDGLESTTREALVSLREVQPVITDLDRVETFMRDADLVKFARLTPSEGECMDLLARAEDIVTRTIGVIAPAPVMVAEAAESELDEEPRDGGLP